MRLLRRVWCATVRNVLGVGFAAALLLTGCDTQPKSDANDPINEVYAGERPALRPIMLGLEVSSHQLLRGIWLGDYDLIRSGSDSIANHPNLPPEDVALVQQALGASFPTFVGYDQEVHRIALDVVDLADRRAPLEEIHTAFVRITAGCIGCHMEFQESVRTLRLR